MTRAEADGVARRRAIVVGVDAPGMPYAVSDARAIAQALTARGFEVALLDNGPGARAVPTRAAVTRTIARVAGACDADDLLLLYVCCHGTRGKDDRGRPWLLLPDGRIALETVLDGLRRRARWGVVLLDSCHMGLGVDPFARALRHSAARHGGFGLLAGSTLDSVALDDLTHSAFSDAVLAALRGAADDPDGGLRFSRLAAHVQRAVAAWNLSELGRVAHSRQRPIVRLEVADLQLAPAADAIALAPPALAAITCAGFSTAGHRLVTGAADGGVQVWDPRTGTPLGVAGYHGAAVTAVAVSRLDIVASGAADGSLKCWQLDRGEAMPPDNRVTGPVRALAWSDAGLARLIGADDGLRLQPVKDLVLMDVGDPFDAAAVSALAWFHGGFASGGTDGHVRWWDGPHRRATSIDRRAAPIRALAASADGHRLVFVAEGAPRLWDLDRARRVMLAGHRGPVHAVAVAPDGALVATAGADGVVRLFDGSTGAARGRLPARAERRAAGRAAPRVAATALAFAPDGRTLFVGHADGRGWLYRR